MRTLSAALKTAQESDLVDPKIKVTFSKTGQSDIVIEEDRIIRMPSEDETSDSQIAIFVFDNSDGYFTALDLKGWNAVVSLGLPAPVTAAYSVLPPFKVRDFDLSSAPAYLQCRVGLVGIPNRLAEDKASKDYLHHWSSTKTVKDLITEVASGTAVSDELTEKQDTSNSYELLNGTVVGAGQKLTINATVTKISFRLKKTGTPPAGNVTFKISAVDDEATLASGILGDANTVLTTSPVWYEVTLAAPVAIAEEVYLWCEYTAGTTGNTVDVSYNSVALKPNENYVNILAAGSTYIVGYDYDCAYRYKYTAAGVDCFTHCEAYLVVYDSEDSLIDVYTPADAFKIYEGDNRLDVINKLLHFTGCEKIVKADGKLHIFVPVTTGTTYDSEYSLETGHAFFSKSIRNSLVIPNKITVHSYKDDDTQYTGYYTDATSFALLPIQDFIKAKLISNAQATAIATAMISRLQVAAQRGSASVPINLGSEVYDYVKVTDSMENDTRTGNIGYIHRSFNSKATWPDCWNMDFSFGKVATKGVMGTKLSLLLPSQVKPEPTMDEQILRWKEVKPVLKDITDSFDTVWKQFDDLIAVLNKLIAFLNYSEDAEPTQTQILAALLGYLKNLVEDTTPQLGGTLDAQGHTISNLAAMRAVTNILLQIGTTNKFTITDTANDSFVPLDMNSNKITALATPTDDADAATKLYVDTHVIATTPSDVTASRAVDTTYTNSTKPILVQATYELVNGGYATAKIHASADPPTTVVAQILNNDATMETRMTLSFIVPAGWKYRIDDSGSVAEVAWIETAIG